MGRGAVAPAPRRQRHARRPAHVAHALQPCRHLARGRRAPRPKRCPLGTAVTMSRRPTPPRPPESFRRRRISVQRCWLARGAMRWTGPTRVSERLSSYEKTRARQNGERDTHIPSTSMMLTTEVSDGSFETTASTGSSALASRSLSATVIHDLGSWASRYWSLSSRAASTISARSFRTFSCAREEEQR